MLVKFRPRRWAGRRGQGLVEYALIIVLVAIVAIIVIGLLGEQVQKIFCDIVLTLGDNAPSIEACEAPRVICSGVANGQTVTGGVNLEALVTDNKGPESITHVEFRVDGALRQTEYFYHYCFSGGDDACTSRSVAHGTHTIEVTAYDADGYTGTCSVTFNVN